MVFSSGERKSLGDGFESWDSAKQKFVLDLEQTQQELRDVRLKIKQSQVEVNKLAKRNASITAHLQKVQAQLERTSKADIRVAYDAALEALQRLFVMRGQLEKLQNDQNALEKHASLLDIICKFIDKGAASSDTGTKNSFATVEMMIQGQEAERQRLSRQMHDGPAQALSNFILQTEIASRLFDVDQGKARDELKVMKTAATSTFQKVRDFIFELRPMMLDDLGLAPTIKRYVDAIDQQKTDIDINMLVTGKERRLEPYIEIVVFRAIQELLRNTITHSQGTEVKMQLDIPENAVKVVVDDNGRGFDSKIIETQKGMGLKLIKERVEMLGGTIDIDSVIGQGARISFHIPTVKQVDFA